MREMDWMTQLGAEIERPVTFTMIQTGGAPDLWRRQLERAGKALENGVELYAQFAARPFGMLFGFPGYHAFTHRPTYRRLKAELGHEEDKIFIIRSILLLDLSPSPLPRLATTTATAPCPRPRPMVMATASLCAPTWVATPLSSAAMTATTATCLSPRTSLSPAMASTTTATALFRSTRRMVTATGCGAWMGRWARKPAAWVPPLVWAAALFFTSGVPDPVSASLAIAGLYAVGMGLV